MVTGAVRAIANRPLLAELGLLLLVVSRVLAILLDFVSCLPGENRLAGTLVVVLHLVRLRGESKLVIVPVGGLVEVVLVVRAAVACVELVGLVAARVVGRHLASLG